MVGFIGSIGALFSRKKSTRETPHQPIKSHATEQTEQNTLTDEEFYRQLLPEDSRSNKQEHLSVPQNLALKIIEEQLFNKASRQSVIPRLPAVIPQLIRSLKNPNASSKDYSDIIRKDPTMSAGVLKLANSVYFNPANNPASNLDAATVKLGIEGLRSVLSTVVMQPVIQQKSPYFKKFGQKIWQHSIATAITCELLAKNRGIDLYKAYLLGLTHNIGKITIFSEICQQMKTLSGDNTIGRCAFIPLLEEKSDLLSWEIAKDWQLPDEIISAFKQQANLQNTQNTGPFALLLAEGKNTSKNYLAYKYGAQEKATEQELKQLGLPGNLYELLDGLT